MREPILRLMPIVILCVLVAGPLGSDHVRAQSLSVPTIASLPPPPTSPYLWFDGADPQAISALAARRTHARTSASYNAAKGYVTARLSSIASADDDTRSKFARAAALLQVLGEVPASGPYATYRDAAVAAVSGLGNRQALDSVSEYLSPPADLINILQDSSRLQSIAEAYDLLRGSGVSAGDNTMLRAKLAAWANAIANDWNLVGYALLAVPGHRDNWAIKGGSALITTALAMPDHAQAASWFSLGQTYVRESFAAVLSATGWYRESAWYLNYSLNNLWSTAWHISNTTGADWLTPLRPTVEFSLAIRQPDGRAPPFEEGLGNVLPWNVMASAYPDLAPAMLWAWDNSNKNVENYENQAIHDVTRFILTDLDTVAAPPSASPTRFVGGDARLAVLATGWDAQALQVSVLSAVDHSTSELIASRHNMRNPLDLVIHGAGAVLVPTASGGPQVSSSAKRSSYLAIFAKNLPLINDNAPFLTAGNAVAFGGRLDSADEGGLENHFADLARTTVSGAYAANTTVSRGLALVDEAFVVVTDRFALPSSGKLAVSWRGRGTRTERAATASMISETWSGRVAQVDLDVTSSEPLTAVGNPRILPEPNAYFSNGWNLEEPIDGVIAQTNAGSASFVSVFQLDEQTPRVVTPASTPDAAAVVIAEGASETVVIAPEAGFATAYDVGTDGDMALVERGPAGLTRFCVDGATTLVDEGEVVLVASAPVTLCASLHEAAVVVEVSVDTASRDLTLALPMFAGHTWEAALEGQAVSAARVGGALTFTGLGSGTLVLTRGDAAPCDDAATRCDDGDGCTVDDCEPSTGECLRTPKPCDDQDACTTDGCAEGECTHAPIDCDDDDACTTDRCVEGTCGHLARVCPADVLCAETASCVPETGDCEYEDGVLPGGDPDGLFCTVAERCEGGTLVVSPRDCGGPVALCAITSVCDETLDACVDSGVIACDERVFHVDVSDAAGQPVGSITCRYDGVAVACDTGPDGTLIISEDRLCE